MCRPEIQNIRRDMASAGRPGGAEVGLGGRQSRDHFSYLPTLQSLQHRPLLTLWGAAEPGDAVSGAAQSRGRTWDLRLVPTLNLTVGQGWPRQASVAVSGAGQHGVSCLGGALAGLGF